MHETLKIVLMRPVNSMIEFKQIVGRGTRMFDGKILPFYDLWMLIITLPTQVGW
jgi:type I site-specific restriction endonuclease